MWDIRMNLVCKYCGKQLKRPCGLVNHEKYCKNNEAIVKCICKFCNKECKNDNSLRNHERLCKLNPNRQLTVFEKYGKDCKFTNKGNHLSDESKRKIASTRAQNKQLGLYTSYGHLQSEETKQKLSIIAKRNNFGGQVYQNAIYYKDVKLDSSYELRVAQSLDFNNIKWVRPKRFLWHDSNGELHHYTPDFYLPDYDVYLDPKNDYLITQDTFKINQVMKEHNIKVIILNKDHLTWDSIATLVFNG